MIEAMVPLRENIHVQRTCGNQGGQKLTRILPKAHPVRASQIDLEHSKHWTCFGLGVLRRFVALVVLMPFNVS